jgi:non-specific serine/threonine protein kinase
MRQYATEKLCQDTAHAVRVAGADECLDADALRSRHRDWFLELSRKATVELRGPDQRRWMELVEAEYGNVRAALDWCLREADSADKALEMCTNMSLFWLIRGYMTEGIDWLEQSLKLPGADQSERRLGALNSLALLWHWHGNGQRAKELSEEIIALGRPIGEKRFVSLALTMLAVLDMDNARFDSANDYCEEGITLAQEAGDNWGYLVALHFRGFIAMFRGELDTAASVLTECVEIGRTFGDWLLVAHSTMGLAGTAMRKGDLDQARALFLESLRDNEMLRYRRGMAECLDGLAQVALRQSQPERAVEIFGAVEAVQQAINIPRQLCDVPDYERALAEIKAHLSPAAFVDAWERGRRLSLEQAVAYARDN